MVHPHFSLSKPLHDNTLHLILFYNQKAYDYLCRKNNLHENIHQARLCCKRIRSVLQLSRPFLDEVTFAEINGFYRDTAGRLSQIRDLTALLETIGGFIEQTKNTDSVIYLKKIVKQLASERENIVQIKEFLQEKNAVEELFEIMQKELSEKLHPFLTNQNVLAGFARTWCRALKHLNNLNQTMDDHIMHEWRKQVKYLWYQAHILIPVWPQIFEILSSECQTLSKILGKHHDMVVFENWLQINISAEHNAKSLKPLLRTLNRRKNSLGKKAMATGNKLFSLYGCSGITQWTEKLSGIVFPGLLPDTK